MRKLSNEAKLDIARECGIAYDDIMIMDDDAILEKYVLPNRGKRLREMCEVDKTFSKYFDYTQLVDYIKAFKDDKDKLDALSQFILDNVSYNYELLSHSKVCKYLKNNDPDSMVDLNNKTHALQFITDLSKQLGLSKNYLSDMLILYKYFYKAGGVSFIDIMPTSLRPIEYEKDILKKGVCEQISQFFKKVCDDAGISCKVIHGDTGFTHAWNIARVGDADLHYDCTYAMYSKDKYSDWGEKTSQKDWLGITHQQLQALHPERKFDAKHM